MEIFQGKGVFPGIAVGEVHLLLKQDAVIDDAHIANTEAEWERFENAKVEADSQLEALFEKTKREIGEEEAMIIDVQRLMLLDGDFNDAVSEKIKDREFSAPYAVSETGKEFSAFFASLEDPYMKARSTDVADISQRIVDVLLGRRTSLQFQEPVVVVADDLTPSETLQMDKSKIRAFVIRKGSANSHTAILARIMNIPCIVQADVPLDVRISGQLMYVDSKAGLCYLDPDEETKEELLVKAEEDRKMRELLDSMRGLPTITKSGKTVKLYSNIGGVEDIDAVLTNDSEGVGLFRSEFLYLGRSDYPTEDELFEAYRKVAEGLADKQVVVRTLDIGADKKVGYFDLDEEENPALGLRGIRICIDRPDLFKTQMRAIYRASAFGNIAIMFPMIISLWEVRRCKEMAAEVRAELTEEGKAFGDVELGIMIETPAAVMIADTLAKEVDFFSVGTNDLTQYTLAIDRQNNKIEKFYDSHHESVMIMLKMIADAANNNGIWCGICGELAADPELVETFVNMGYHELSVSPTYTLSMRKQIREME